MRTSASHRLTARQGRAFLEKRGCVLYGVRPAPTTPAQREAQEDMAMVTSAKPRRNLIPTRMSG